MTATELPYEQKSEQMFLGQYERGLDPKGRITLPANYRELLGDRGAFVTRGLDRCLVIFPREDFEAWRRRIRELPMTSRRGRDLRRHIFSGAAEIIPDGQGRINLPQHLRAYASIESDVIVAGSDNYIEIWDARLWDEARTSFEASGDDVAAWETLGI
ncbi:MAG: division/cell wall cluster transcriptional repressor MraZ [Caldilineales bacterium]|nr:division/cell wall cluster transcriptional repressor MraZ [Caldilineales bacterium]